LIRRAGSVSERPDELAQELGGRGARSAEGRDITHSQTT
jgi:hypothetical protein